jgi:sec-independent protein translocase protein TatB
MPFNLGAGELLLILVVALLVLGPDKLPGAARNVGRMLGELRRLSTGFQSELRDALREPVEGTPVDQPTPAPAGEGDLRPVAAEEERPPVPAEEAPPHPGPDEARGGPAPPWPEPEGAPTAEAAPPAGDGHVPADERANGHGAPPG